MIFLLALLARLGALDRYVTPDELHWVERSIRFSQALSQGDLASTVQAGHPGVTTMWLGSLGLTLQRVFNPAAPVPGALPEFAPQNAEAMRYLAQFLTPMRWPVILVTSLNLVLLFWLLSRVVDRRAAFLAAALVALDPFAVALGGILHVDSLLMTFSLASLAALSVGLNRPSPQPLSLLGRGWRAAPGEGWLVLSGVLAGLAMLSKSPAIVLVPTAGLVIALDAFHKRASFGTVIRSSLIWGVSAAFIFIALYPAMWAAPLKALQRLTETAEKHSETAHAVNFFFGNSERDPGAAFYPVVAAFRSTPVLWLGLLAALILIARARTDHAQRLRRAMWPYWVFAIVFLGMVTLVAKKLDRYVLPTLEALNVIGAFGLAFMIDFLMRPGEAFGPKPVKRRLIANAAPLLLMIVAAIQFLAVWPLTLRAYNPLLGGYAGASAALPVGGGESAEVARQLNAPLIASRSIATTDIVGTAPFFAGTLWPATVEGFAQSDLLLFNASDVQLTPDTVNNWVGNTSPVMTLTVQSQPFAWLYENAWLKADQLRVAQRQADDAVIVDAALTALPVPAEATTIITSAFTADQAVELLQKISQSQRRVFVYHFANQPDRNTLELFRALDTYAVSLDQWASPLSRGGLYALPEPSAFAIQPLSLN
ncbi:MAG: phospholipid carrier-dependent glycosyltransferase, partial [Thermoflexales bacterium]|nr:phospholipid carrier-dependent glycosyltransferase [Thermoflexales bacterium]